MFALRFFAGPIVHAMSPLGLLAVSVVAGPICFSWSAFALFVDEGAEARALIRQNIQALGTAGISRIFRRDATRLGSIGTMLPFDLVLADPPKAFRGYPILLIAAAMAAMAFSGFAGMDFTR